MSTKVTLDVNGVLERLSSAVGAENDHQLAQKTGTAQTTISTWRSKGRIPYELCTQVAKEFGAHIGWLLFGDEGINIGHFEDRPGLIDISFFDFCWSAAGNVINAEPSIERKLAAVVIYNSMWRKLNSELAGSTKLTREQAALAYVVFDNIGMFDWAKIARSMREQLDKYPSVEIDVFDHRSVSKRQTKPRR